MSRSVLWALRALLVALCAAAFAVACSGGDDPPDPAPDAQQAAQQTTGQAGRADQQAPPQADEQDEQSVLNVVVSTQVIADWVRQVGGDRVNVSALVPAGADAHTLELSTGDIRDVAGADLVIINGAGLESSYVDAITDNASNLLNLTEELEARGLELQPFSSLSVDPHEEDAHDDEEDHAEDDAHDQSEAHDDDAEDHDEHEEDQEGEEHEGEEGGEQAHDHGSEDPHYWLDPDFAAAAVVAIADALAQLAPAADFDDRAEAYIGQIEAADAEVRAILADLPEHRRLIVTFHDAFGYFARRYGLTVAGFVVEGPEQGISASTVAELVELIEHEGITRIYREPQFESAAVEAVAAESGAEVGIIWSQPQGDVLTYVELLRANAESIAAD